MRKYDFILTDMTNHSPLSILANAQFADYWEDMRQNADCDCVELIKLYGNKKNAMVMVGVDRYTEDENGFISNSPDDTMHLYIEAWALPDGENLAMWLEKPANKIANYLIEEANERGLVRPFDLMTSKTVNGMGKCYYVLQDDPEYWAELDCQTDKKSPEYEFFWEHQNLIDICYMLSMHAYRVNIEELVEE